MSDNPADVYRTSQPAIVDAFKRAAKDVIDWRNAVYNYAQEVTGEENGRVWFSKFLDMTYVRAFDIGDRDDVPVGWRRESKGSSRIVPNRRTQLGRDANKRLEQFGDEPSVRKPLTGMPISLDGEYTESGGRHMHTFGTRLIGDDTVEVTWSVVAPADKVDHATWTRVPLSQWHSEREAG